MPKLAPSFTGFELVRSVSHPTLVIPFEDIPAAHAANLQRLVDLFLQPVRDRVGKLRVLSAYRPESLNRLLPGASSRSRHMLGLGCDFLPDFFDQVALFQMLARGEIVGAQWDRLALYTERDVPNFHVDLRPWEAGEQRGKLFVATPKWTEVTVDEVLQLAA